MSASRTYVVGQQRRLTFTAEKVDGEPLLIRVQWEGPEPQAYHLRKATQLMNRFRAECLP